jgi:hypothetical protein
MLDDWYYKGLFPGHCQEVEDLTKMFEAKLGYTTSIFAEAA